MRLDTLLFILIGIFFTAMAVLGGLIHSKNWRYYTHSFITIAVITAILIFVQGLRNQTTQEEAKKNERTLRESLEDLKASNKELAELLAPIQKLAEEKFPNLSPSEALEKMKEDLSRLQSRTAVLEQETQKTVFRISDRSGKILSDGTYEANFTLTPIGENIIPMFRVVCITQNDAIITELSVKGPTIPIMSWNEQNKNKTGRLIKYDNIYPGIVNITVRADKHPGQMQCTIDPTEQ